MFSQEKTFRPWLIYVAAVFIFSADRWLKGVAWAYGEPAGHPVEYALYLNKGIAFSLPMPTWLFWPLALAATVAVVWLGFGPASRQSKFIRPLAVMVLMGGASNLFDRQTVGATIDYLIFFGVSAVNLADAMVVGGLLGMILLSRHKPPPIAPAPTNEKPPA